MGLLWVYNPSHELGRLTWVFSFLFLVDFFSILSFDID
jgi:hypothetical protein